MTSQNDIEYMRAALSIARRGLGRVWPNPSVGCVLVKDGNVIARGVTADGGRPHAEAAALEQAGAQARGSTAYVTLEPCAHHGQTGPCAEALAKAGIKRAVIACVDPDPCVSGKGIEILKSAGIEVTAGVLEEEAKELNKGFFLRVTENRPLVTLKMATGKDGHIPLSGWITSETARRHGHLARSMHDAILVGIGTALTDNPQLTTRIPGVNHPIVRVILDTHLRLPLDSALVKTMESSLWVIHGKGAKSPELEKLGAKLFESDMSAKAVARTLAEQGITRLLVEGGPKVWTSFIKEGVYDRVLWYRAPQDALNGQPALPGVNFKSLPLKAAGSRPLGQDLLEIYEKSA